MYTHHTHWDSSINVGTLYVVIERGNYLNMKTIHVHVYWCETYMYIYMYMIWIHTTSALGISHSHTYLHVHVHCTYILVHVCIVWGGKPQKEGKVCSHNMYIR